MIKELLISFFICLVIGAIINGMSVAPPPPADDTEMAEPAEPGAGETVPGEAPIPGESPATTPSSGQVRESSEATFEKDVLESKVPVLVDFYAKWCGPCKQMSPVISKLAREYKGKVKVVKIDTDENQALCQKYDITALPSFVMFRSGRNVAKYTGAMPREMLAGVIDRQLGIQ